MSSGTLETGIEHKNSSLYRSGPCSVGCLAWNSNSSSPPSSWQPQPSPQISKMLSRGYPLLPTPLEEHYSRTVSFMRGLLAVTSPSFMDTVICGRYIWSQCGEDGRMERERQSPRYLLSSWIPICLMLDLTSVLPSLHEHKISFEFGFWHVQLEKFGPTYALRGSCRRNLFSFLLIQWYLIITTFFFFCKVGI